MNQEHFDQIKQTVVELEAQAKDAFSLVVATNYRFLLAEIERLQADSRALAALQIAVKPVIDQIGLDARMGPRIGVDGRPTFEIILAEWEAEALRAALEANR